MNVVDKTKIINFGKKGLDLFGKGWMKLGEYGKNMKKANPKFGSDYGL